MDPVLASMLLDLDKLSDEDAEREVFNLYTSTYLNTGDPPSRMGVVRTHDGFDCIFTESRFAHAFFWDELGLKKMFSKVRGARVAWIRPLVAGNLVGSECWLTRSEGRCREQRLYILRDECFVVWLEPAKEGNWWFSTAYRACRGDLRKYCKGGKHIWVQKKPRDYSAHGIRGQTPNHKAGVKLLLAEHHL